MTKAQNNFQQHMARFCSERGFVPNCQTALWINAEKYFSIYAADYQAIMPYSYFIKNIIK